MKPWIRGDQSNGTPGAFTVLGWDCWDPMQVGPTGGIQPLAGPSDSAEPHIHCRTGSPHSRSFPRMGTPLVSLSYHLKCHLAFSSKPCHTSGPRATSFFPHSPPQWTRITCRIPEAPRLPPSVPCSGCSLPLSLAKAPSPPPSGQRSLLLPGGTSQATHN